MPYMEKISEAELVRLLPHHWKLVYPEIVIANLRKQVK